MDDVALLMRVFDRLVQQGNSLLVIEHHLEVIKCADYVIDLGPEGGDAGGLVVAKGTPEQVAKVERSHTGRFLREVLAARNGGSAGSGAGECRRTLISYIAENGAESEPLMVAEDSPQYMVARARAESAKRASSRHIGVHGAREHNLKNISLEIPRDQMVIVTGRSGSGKSTLAFDILFAEGPAALPRFDVSLCAAVRRATREA